MKALGGSKADVCVTYRELVYSLVNRRFDRYWKALSPRYVSYLNKNAHIKPEERYISKFVGAHCHSPNHTYPKNSRCVGVMSLLRLHLSLQKRAVFYRPQSISVP